MEGVENIRVGSHILGLNLTRQEKGERGWEEVSVREKECGLHPTV